MVRDDSNAPLGGAHARHHALPGRNVFAAGVVRHEGGEGLVRRGRCMSLPLHTMPALSLTSEAEFHGAICVTLAVSIGPTAEYA